MSIELCIFYFFVSTTLLSAAGILFTNNLLHAACMLMVSLLSVAGIFIFAGADFLAVAQVMIYIGGILVIILFGIMLTKNEQVSNKKWNLKVPVVALSAAFGLFYLLYVFISDANLSAQPWIAGAVKSNNYVISSTIQPIGILLMTKYLFHFELAGIILLLALIGSAFIAGKIKVK